MHNRVRLVVGSFLTKDLHLDWRAGEAWFARLLLDGEPAQNTGNWQWIASVGADPAPVFRRLYNPARHQERYDPDGVYVRRWVPELRAVPDERLAEPWTMTDDEQQAAGCVIGEDYPAPIVDHAAERRRGARALRLGAVIGLSLRGSGAMRDRSGRDVALVNGGRRGGGVTGVGDAPLVRRRVEVRVCRDIRGKLASRRSVGRKVPAPRTRSGPREGGSAVRNPRASSVDMLGRLAPRRP